MKLLFSRGIPLAIVFMVISALNGKPATSATVSAAPISVNVDSDSIKSQEERWFLKYADRATYPTCKVAHYSDKVLTLTADANEWNQQSEQDKISAERALYVQWLSDYKHFHTAVDNNTSFVLHIVDINGIKLASYF